MDEALVEDAEHEIDHEDREHAAACPCPRRNDWNACAVPWNDAGDRVGHLQLRAPRVSMRSTAWLSDTPGARLNDSVTDGTWPRWLIVAAPTELSKCATADSGHELAPLFDLRM